MPRLWFTASESLTLNLFLKSTIALMQTMTQGNDITVMKVAGLRVTTCPLWNAMEQEAVCPMRTWDASVEDALRRGKGQLNGDPTLATAV